MRCSRFHPPAIYSIPPNSPFRCAHRSVLFAFCPPSLLFWHFYCCNLPESTNQIKGKRIRALELRIEKDWGDRGTTEADWMDDGKGPLRKEGKSSYIYVRMQHKITLINLEILRSTFMYFMSIYVLLWECPTWFLCIIIFENTLWSVCAASLEIDHDI